MVTRPPRGMASRALTIRFRSTCSSWPGSAFTHPRSWAGTVTRSMSSPIRRRSIFSTCATTLLTSSTRISRTCRRLKARSWRVSAAARCAASTINVTSRAPGPSPPRRCWRKWQRPVITVRRLLKSWATPPASCPTASIFCDWRSCSSIRRSRVTSRRSATWLTRRPWASQTGDSAASSSVRLPSRRLPVSRPDHGSAPAAPLPSASAKPEPSSACLSPRKSWPTTSSRAWPVVRSKAGFT